MTELPQYHFSRSDFVKVWVEVLGDRSDDVLEMCARHANTDNFELWTDEFEEWCIKHIPTGVIVNWYKGWHLGRTNTCTDPNFTLDDFRTFLTQLKSELNGVTDDESSN